MYNGVLTVSVCTIDARAAVVFDTARRAETFLFADDVAAARDTFARETFARDVVAVRAVTVRDDVALLRADATRPDAVARGDAAAARELVFATVRDATVGTDVLPVSWATSASSAITTSSTSESISVSEYSITSS